jgi:hypothetical protein
MVVAAEEDRRGRDPNATRWRGFVSEGVVRFQASEREESREAKKWKCNRQQATG